MNRFLVTAFLILFTSLSSLRSDAQEEGAKGLVKKDDKAASQAAGKIYGLVTGISQYEDNTTYQNLKYADIDAREFYRFLVSKKGGKAEVTNVDTLFNQQANFMEFWKKFHRIKEKLQPNDIFYIYFSGHGDAYRADEAYLLAYDAPAGNDRNNYSTGMGLIDIHKLKVRISEMTAKGVKVILITDACRTNELPGKEEGKSIAYEEIFAKKAGEIQLISCASNQYSFEGYQWGGGRGLFSWHLVNGLKGMADTGPEDGEVTLTELYDYVKKEVNRASYDKNNKEYRQTPQYCCASYDGLVMAVVDPAEKEKLAMELKTGVTNPSGEKMLAVGKGVNLGIAMKNAGYEDLYKEFMKALNEGRLIEANGAYDILKKILAKKEFPADLAGELKFELSSRLMTDVARVINTYLHASQNNNEYTYDYFMVAARKLNLFTELADTSYYNPLDVEVNRLFLEGHANWRSYKTQDLMECLAKVDSAVALKPQAAYLYNLKGLMHVALRQFPQAEKALHTGIALAPNWLYPHHNLGYAFNEQRKYDSALHYYKMALALDTSYQTTYSGIAGLYSSQGKVDTALYYVRKGLQKDPNDQYLWTQLGFIYYWDKKYDQATPAFHKAVVCDSTYNFSYEGLLRVHVFSTNNADSVEYYAKKLIALDPTNPLTYQGLGNIFTESEMYDDAYRMYDIAIGYDSLNPAIWKSAAYAYSKGGKDTIALGCYLKAVGLDSTDAYSYNDAGNILYRLAYYDFSLEMMAKAIKNSPDDKVLYANYAFISAANKDTVSAKKYYLISLGKDPKYGWAAYEFARILATEGNKAEALKYIAVAAASGDYRKQDFLDEPSFAILKDDKKFNQALSVIK
jgi:tetratricopeptide (TPR) repeat protein